MLTLDVPTKVLQANIDTSGSATDIHITAAYLNYVSGIATPKTWFTKSNGSTFVTATPAPSSGANLIKSIYAYNASSTLHNVTLRVHDTTGSTMDVLIGSYTLSPSAGNDFIYKISNPGLYSNSGDMLSSTIYSPQVISSGSITLDSSYVSQWVHCSGGSAQNVYLPLANSVAAGNKIGVMNVSPASGTSPIVHTVLRSGSDTCYFNSTSVVARTGFKLLSGNFVVLESNGVNSWTNKLSSFDTQWISGGPTVITATVTSPTKGNTVIDRVTWRRRGSQLIERIEYLQNSAGTAGSGTYLYLIPGGFVADTTYFPLANNTAYGPQIASNGPGFMGSGNGVNAEYFGLNDSTHLLMFYSFGSGLHDSTHSPFSGSSLAINSIINIPISGW